MGLDGIGRGPRHRVSGEIVAGNLFANLPDASGAEIFEILVKTPGIRLVRIVSAGQATPPGEWCNQDEAEWVVVLSGCALLVFEDEPAPRRLAPGDHVLIPPHVRHRVESTSNTKATVWLALHFTPAD